MEFIETRNRYPFWLRTLSGLLVCLWIAVAPVAKATDDLCGAAIVADLKLDHDLTCVGNGLIVGADGVRLNLNGHTITGSGTAPGSGFGVDVVGRTNVSIGGGTVNGFAAGVRVMNSSDVVIKNNELRANGDGIDFQAGSINNTIKENVFRDNGARGIMLRGGVTDNVIKENTFTGNRVGILVFAGVENTIKENLISASLLAGIRINVFAADNLILENTIASNPTGIEFLVTTTGSSTGNALVENRIFTNGCGLKGPTGGNTLTENVFEGNLVNVCQ